MDRFEGGYPELESKYKMVGFMFIMAITHHTEGFSSEATQAFYDNFSAKPLEIDLKVNGVPVSFTAVCRTFEEAWDQEVAKAAKRLLVEKAQGFSEKTYALFDRLERAIKNEMRTVFPSVPDDDEY